MFLKRLFDIVFSLVIIILFSPIIIISAFIIWLEDFHNPFYLAPRVGTNGKKFLMIKLRTMAKNADSTGVDSTSNNDNRITKTGRIIRKFKLDELPQFFNVLLGSMSVVGPRPNVERETNLYTTIEKNILNIKPGITDFSSIVFADEGNILKDKKNPDIAYNQLIRPWKSTLAIFYIDHRSFLLDVKIIVLTVLSLFNREKSLDIISKTLLNLNAKKELVAVSLRKEKLIPIPPLGASNIIQSRTKI